jgi:predicted Rossmann-fold nucleotide-binding protein
VKERTTVGSGLKKWAVTAKTVSRAQKGVLFGGAGALMELYLLITMTKCSKCKTKSAHYFGYEKYPELTNSHKSEFLKRHTMNPIFSGFALT